MRVEVWSDVACPWCLLGKRHLEEAARRSGVDLDLVMRSFELNPRAGATVPVREHLLPRFGSVARIDAAHARLRAMGEAAGIRYDFSRALVANTFDAHRVHHRAASRGVGGAVIDRFMLACHGEGADLADHATIRRLAVEAGMDAADVQDVLASDAHAADVRVDEASAARIGVSGVPFFVFEGRHGLSGAQPVEVFERVLAAVRSPPA